MNMIDKATMNYTQCTCIDVGTEVRREWCKDDCKPMIIIYFAIATLSGFISGMGVVPAILIVLRSVPPQWRSVSIGFSGFIVSIGTLLSPPFYGYIIDTACVQWERTCGGHTGSCMIYKPADLRNRLHIVYGLLRACGCLLDMVVLYYAANLKLISDDVDDDSSAQSPATDTLSGEEPPPPYPHHHIAIGHKLSSSDNHPDRVTYLRESDLFATPSDPAMGKTDL